MLREMKLLLSHRTVAIAMVLLTLLVCASLFTGQQQIERQREAISSVRTSNAQAVATVMASINDYGSAAYYGFHLTWSEPSDLASLAVGQRDVAPYMLRVRALALEGQVYEADSMNPELSLAGYLDFAFVLAYLVPLFVILVMHDIYSGEKEAGRWALLVVTAGRGARLWRQRALVRVGAVLSAVLLPLVLFLLASQVSLFAAVAVVGVVIAVVALWGVLALGVQRLMPTSTASAALLIALWFVTSLLVPVLAKPLIDQRVPGVDGAQIAMAQREAVNDAWDLPKETTMEKFLQSYPEYADRAAVTAPFEWKWYYAFQHNGDVAVASMSQAYREAIRQRHDLVKSIAWLSPAVAVQLILQDLAGTGVEATLAYDRQVYAFHKALTEFYYHKLFNDEPYTLEALDGLPRFEDIAES